MFRLYALFFVAVSCVTSGAAQDDFGKWIWTSGDQNKPAYFVKTFSLDTLPKSAVVCASGDNEFQLFVNGKPVCGGKRWEVAERADVRGVLRTGSNTLAVEAKNHGGIAAFMLHLRLVAANGSMTRISTNETWLASGRPTKNWKQGGVDNGDWGPPRVMGVVGDKKLPWTGRINSDSLEALLASGEQSEMVPLEARDVTCPDGFVVEKVFRVPRVMGSWVALTSDDRGGLIASDQGGAGLFRITPGTGAIPTKVVKIPVDLSGAQGLLWAFESLYAMVNGGPKSGLHRITDSDGDGELDTDEHVMFVPGGGEHGPHAITLSPDKKSLFVYHCGVEVLDDQNGRFIVKVTEVRNGHVDEDEREFDRDRYRKVILITSEDCPTNFGSFPLWDDFGGSRLDVVFHGSSKNDVMYGGKDMYGYEGNDSIHHGWYARGGEGDDTISNVISVDAGDGNDKIYAHWAPGFGVGTIDGGDGHDQINATYPVRGSLDGGEGNDLIRYNGHNGCKINGGPGNDVIHSKDGNDTINAGPGNDWVFAGGGDDDVFGGPGYDNLFGEAGSDNMWAGELREPEGFVWGGSGPDQFFFRDPARAGTIYDDFNPRRRGCELRLDHRLWHPSMTPVKRHD